MMHDDLVSWDGALLSPESRMRNDGSQQQAAHEEYEVTLLPKLVLEHVVEQDQQQILGPYSEELFDALPKEHSAPSLQKTQPETSSEPGPYHGNRSLGENGTTPETLGKSDPYFLLLWGQMENPFLTLNNIFFQEQPFETNGTSPGGLD
ncbi:unnamed protein product [Caretta caretta]